MIGDVKSRGKGLGKESVLAAEFLMKEKYKMSVAIAKIKEDNTASINLFLKKDYKETERTGGDVIMKKDL